MFFVKILCEIPQDEAVARLGIPPKCDRLSLRRFVELAMEF